MYDVIKQIIRYLNKTHHRKQKKKKKVVSLRGNDIFVAVNVIQLTHFGKEFHLHH